MSLTKFASHCLSYGGIFDWDRTTARLKELNVLAETHNLWDDAERARAVMQERQQLDDAIKPSQSWNAALPTIST